YRTILTGQRTADAPKPSSFIADDNQKYSVEWEQCGNPRAPRSVAELSRSPKAREKAQANEVEGTGYDCGEATVYKPDGVLETKKHDRASHVITFVAPPNPACWTGETAPAAGGAPSAADAGAAPAPAAGDAGATEPAAGAATDAGAHSDAGPAAAGDAGPAKAKP